MQDGTAHKDTVGPRSLRAATRIAKRTTPTVSEVTELAKTSALDGEQMQ
jgi:hypothetical protein